MSNSAVMYVVLLVGQFTLNIVINVFSEGGAWRSGARRLASDPGKLRRKRFLTD
jgi:hypothetical protein